MNSPFGFQPSFIRGIPMWQPFAQLAIDGLKPIETRLRYTNIRGRIVVCATQKSAPPHVYKSVLGLLVDAGIDPTPYYLGNLQCGVALGTVNLVQCRTMEEADSPRAWVTQYTPEAKLRYAWLFENPSKFKVPFEVKCGQGWFNILSSRLENEILT